MMKRRITIVAAAITLTACASAPAPAPYQAAAGAGAPGYVTAPAASGRHTVAYTGAKGMSRAQVAEYALLRAAEFTVESGQEWFAVITTKTQNVQLERGQEDLQGRSGGFVSGESAGTGTGGSAAPSPGGVSESATRGGASTGGFGGGDVPYQVIERWKPPTVPQTVIVIQMGKGSQANFEGLDKAPEIYSAKSVADDLRSKMTP